MTALIVVGLALLVTTAAFLASTARPASALSFLLGSYLAAWVTVVLVTTILSVAGIAGQVGLLTSFIAALAVVVVAWSAAGRPKPPSLLDGITGIRITLRDPMLAVLAATVLGAAGYAVIIGIATPQNEWDALSYHLTRAAFWLQQGSVAYVPDVMDVRINVNPPVAEIGQFATLALNGSDAFSWLPEFSGAVALCLAAFGIARRAGLEEREALFGVLVLACLPLVVLQSSTALNDLVVASFLATATYFALGSGRRSAAATAVALGLGVGTKVVALFLLPVYLLVVLVARRRTPWAQAGILVAGVVIGSGWYIINFAETGTWDGGLASMNGQIPDRQPALILTRAAQLATRALELPGAVHHDVLMYPIVAALFVVLGLTVSRRSGRSAGFSVAMTGALVSLVPLVVWCLARGTTWSWRSGWTAVGRDDLATQIPAHFSPSTIPDSSSTWFGPVGALLAIGGVFLAFRRAGSDRALRVVCAIAPLILLVIVAAAVSYDPWRGRFFLYAMALASVAWGLAYRFRALAWAIALASAVTTPLALVHSYGKPPGIRLIQPVDAVPYGQAHGLVASPSVFGAPRWSVQTWIRRGDGTDVTLRFVEQHIPADATIGLALRSGDFVFPYFGHRLGRTVRLIPSGATVPPEVMWLIEAPHRSVPLCGGSWEYRLSKAKGFRILHRTHADVCD